MCLRKLITNCESVSYLLHIKGGNGPPPLSHFQHISLIDSNAHIFKIVILQYWHHLF
jgi:hypothetical protein